MAGGGCGGLVVVDCLPALLLLLVTALEIGYKGTWKAGNLQQRKKSISAQLYRRSLVGNYTPKRNRSSSRNPKWNIVYYDWISEEGGC